MRVWAAIVFCVMCAWGAASPAVAKVQIDIDLSAQRMHVTSTAGSYSWPISSARSGYATPRGSYAPYSLQTMHYSHKYHMSPMPHSIFFNGGYAIHGTYSTAELGRPASHGCIRLSPANAAHLFSMVKAEGAAITISGSPPSRTMYAKVHKAHPKTQMAARYRSNQALGYAPARQQPETMRAWQYNPIWQ